MAKIESNGHTSRSTERTSVYEKWGGDKKLLAGFRNLTDLMQSALEEGVARIEELSEQLTASQAREQQLREALVFLNSRIVTMDLGGVVERALSLPSDTTAIDAFIQKAGEVMRERCIDLLSAQADGIKKSGFIDRDCSYSTCDESKHRIRALPGVTLEDLK